MVQRLLLDTHTLLWVAEGGRRLRPDTYNEINAVDNEIFVSPVSIWEISIKFHSGRLPLIHTLSRVLESINRYGFTELHIDFSHAELAGALPLIHRDPFDRMLIAQAQAEELTLVTDDSQIARYQVPIMPAQ